MKQTIWTYVNRVTAKLGFLVFPVGPKYVINISKVFSNQLILCSVYVNKPKSAVVLSFPGFIDIIESDSK